MSESAIRFPDANSYPRWWVPVALGSGVPAYFVFDYFGSPARGFAAALSIASIVTVLVSLRNLKTYFSFWLVMLVCVIAHVVLVSVVPFDADTHFPGIIFTPLVFADCLFWTYAAVSTVRLFRH
jgi:hypothetical protein